jgi:hypothetical protein
MNNFPFIKDLIIMSSLVNVLNKNVDVLFSARDAFLEKPSSVASIFKILESHIKVSGCR